MHRAGNIRETHVLQRTIPVYLAYTFDIADRFSITDLVRSLQQIGHYISIHVHILTLDLTSECNLIVNKDIAIGYNSNAISVYRLFVGYIRTPSLPSFFCYHLEQSTIRTYYTVTSIPRNSTPSSVTSKRFYLKGIFIRKAHHRQVFAIRHMTLVLSF